MRVLLIFIVFGFRSPEQWLDARTKQKREKIAGIDQDELLDPSLLADPDSCFCEFRGVQIHHKVYDAESQANNSSQSHTLTQVAHNNSWKLRLPMILLHGFGASVYSWSRAMKPLAELTGSKVLAFDRPAFGLTSRVDASTHLSTGTNDEKPLNPYSLSFSVLATLYFIDFLAAEKIVLVGYAHFSCYWCVHCRLFHDSMILLSHLISGLVRMGDDSDLLVS